MACQCACVRLLLLTMCAASRCPRVCVYVLVSPPQRCAGFAASELCETDAEHALLCKLLSGAFTLRHDILVGFWCRAASRAGIASSKEPVLRQLQRQEHAARRRARGDGQRGDALFVLHEGVLVIDVSVVHPAAETYVQDAANTDGAAAAARGARKVQMYSCGQAGGGYDFEPVIVET